MTTDELIRTVGDPRILAEELFQADRDVQALEGHWDDLFAKHEGEWVGVLKGDFLFASTLEDLIEIARKEQWDVGAMVVDRLKEQQSAMLF